MGNLRSVEKALEHVGAEVRRVAHPREIAHADAVVLPGVGAVGDCVAALQTSGLGDLVRGWIREDRPFLGVCLGMQALFDWSEENEGVAGLRIFPGAVRRFQLPADYKVPHMGWNTVLWRPGVSAGSGLEEPARQFYFVHSYHCVPDDSSIIAATADYGGPFVASIARGRAWATQFHPEKSQDVGLRLYANFVACARGV
jgi:glutamine amidotransferase